MLSCKKVKMFTLMKEICKTKCLCDTVKIRIRKNHAPTRHLSLIFILRLCRIFPIPTLIPSVLTYAIVPIKLKPNLPFILAFHLKLPSDLISPHVEVNISTWRTANPGNVDCHDGECPTAINSELRPFASITLI